GHGFYTSRSLAHAEARAVQMAERFGGKPSVLEFRVSSSELGELNGLSFTEPNTRWQNFVKANRTGAPPHGYDYVSGPTLSRFSSGGEVVPWSFPEYNQTSFHSQRAVDLIGKGLQ